MSQHQIGGSLGAFAVPSRNRAGLAGSVATNVGIYATPVNYISINSLDTRLSAASPSVYTQATLDKMTANDKIYALRLIDDVGTI